MIATTPSGTRTWVSCRPFGSTEPRTTVPTGSGSPTRSRRPVAIASTRESFSRNRSTSEAGGAGRLGGRPRRGRSPPGSRRAASSRASAIASSAASFVALVSGGDSAGRGPGPGWRHRAPARAWPTRSGAAQTRSRARTLAPRAASGERTSLRLPRRLGAVRPRSVPGRRAMPVPDGTAIRSSACTTGCRSSAGRFGQGAADDPGQLGRVVPDESAGHHLTVRRRAGRPRRRIRNHRRSAVIPAGSNDFRRLHARPPPRRRPD